MNALPEAALGFGRRGWRVIPLHSIRDGRCTCGRSGCESAGKHPRLASWPTQASSDPAAIARWFRQWPSSNVGIVTGGASGLLVLDVDPRHDGDATLAELERAHGPLPETPRALTGGGGVHAFFRHPGGAIANRAGLAHGLDVRGDGGFVVAAPSLHASGRRYCWEHGAAPEDVMLAAAPRWLLDRLTQGAGDRLRADGTALVITAGERNRRLYQLGCLLRRYGVGEGAIRGALAAINAAHVRPPLEGDELARIAASAARQAPHVVMAAAPVTLHAAGGAGR